MKTNASVDLPVIIPVYNEESNIPANVGNFYLLDRKAMDAFNAVSERHRFNRGLVAWLGF